jgi:hypothetical protein
MARFTLEHLEPLPGLFGSLKTAVKIYIQAGVLITLPGVPPPPKKNGANAAPANNYKTPPPISMSFGMSNGMFPTKH